MIDVYMLEAVKTMFFFSRSISIVFMAHATKDARKCSSRRSADDLSEMPGQDCQLCCPSIEIHHYAVPNGTEILAEQNFYQVRDPAGRSSVSNCRTALSRLVHCLIIAASVMNMK